MLNYKLPMSRNMTLRISIRLRFDDFFCFFLCVFILLLSYDKLLSLLYVGGMFYNII